jgi:hypothetical protein
MEGMSAVIERKKLRVCLVARGSSEILLPTEILKRDGVC